MGVGDSACSPSAQEWALYRFDSDSFPHVYEFLKPGPKIQDLLDEIAADPTFIFWG